MNGRYPIDAMTAAMNYSNWSFEGISGSGRRGYGKVRFGV